MAHGIEEKDERFGRTHGRDDGPLKCARYVYQCCPRSSSLSELKTRFDNPPWALKLQCSLAGGVIHMSTFRSLGTDDAPPKCLAGVRVQPGRLGQPLTAPPATIPYPVRLFDFSTSQHRTRQRTIPTGKNDIPVHASRTCSMRLPTAGWPCGPVEH